MKTTKFKELKNFTRDGFKLSYSIEGNGIEGIVIGSAHFYPLVFSEEFKKQMKLMYVDHRGFGETQKQCHISDFDLDRILDDIEFIRLKENFGKIIIIGHSAHGYMALEYAKKYPDSVSGVILIATGPSHGHHMMAAQIQWEESVCPERKLKFAKDQNKYLPLISQHPERSFVYYCLSLESKSWFDLNHSSEYLWKDVNVNMLGMNYLYGEVFREIQIERGLEDLDIPILIAMGRFDYLVAPYHSWDAYRKFFKNLTLRVFNESAHYPQIEEPELFQIEIGNWLNRNKSNFFSPCQSVRTTQISL